MKSELSAPAGWAPAPSRRLPASAPAALLVVATAALLLAGTLWPAWRAVAWWLPPVLGLALFLHGRFERRRAVDERREWRTKIDDAGLSLAQWVPGGPAAASAGWQERLGAPDPADPLAWLERVHAVDRMKLEEHLPALLEGSSDGGADSLQHALRLPDDAGDWIWHELRLRVVRRDARGQARQVLASLQDIQWRRTAEERQRMSSGLFQHLHEGLAITDLQHRLLDANPAYWTLMSALLDAPAGLVIDDDGRAPDTAEALRRRMLGQPALPLDPAQLRRSGHEPEAIAEALADPAGHWQGLVKVRGPGGQPRTLRLTVSSIPEPEGPPRYRVLALSDLTQDLQRQQALERLGRFDLLTGLPNEQEFLRRLQAALQTSRQVGPGFMLCVARVDLDGFAAFNRRHGAARADQALRELARRLTTALRQAPQWSDEVARLGGDEFGLLLRVQDAEEAQRALDRLVQVLRRPIEPEDGEDGTGSAPAAPVAAADEETPTAPMFFDSDYDAEYRAHEDSGFGSAEGTPGGALRLSASVGATLFPQDGGEAETLLRHAAHALYRVKRSGRDGVQFFDVEKRRSREAQAQAVLRVQQALEAGELCLYYQPKMDLVTGELLGAEALLRWRHPQRGLLAPAAFLPTVERSGMAAQLGHWVLEQALEQCRIWRSEGLDLELSINISPRHLAAPAFCARLEALLARHPDVPPGRVVLELLESSALDDVDHARHLLAECKRIGLRLAMDDFGTGYATLSVLKQLPLDRLKIDRSFVQTMLVDPQDRALVQGVIALAGQFGCELVAEGVESPAHARALVEMGCRVGQGSGLCEPLPPQTLLAWALRRAPSRGRPLEAIT
ncbi:EAL domain-containing protein [Mitsuaria sp. GD03876]|uniref:putative bifunctional diguanylate cyclase/phosphodiesterase n=1 Tax=Mitsuaria sp. GD03876 TaxID=2975399 RepID=UPI0024472A71|nr:EAL domain-containing protein [Mitsuaria sp. GD03876]MDH0864639.1 EAL domain-containing protein [Mitsuaria sp. GD03876]